MVKLGDRSVKPVCVLLAVVVVFLSCVNCSRDRKSHRPTALTTKFCISASNTIKARHKSCFLRPDTGPCRADIIQWYFDAKMRKCYRFFWGGCQGNGNKFQTKTECLDHCWLNETTAKKHRPLFCDLTFSYGTCFGHYERWYYDTNYKACKRRIYSGCGGNQNNFETMDECNKNCISFPDHGFVGMNRQYTTCVTLDMPDQQRKKRDLGRVATLPSRKISHNKRRNMRRKSINQKS